jgi:hypothetical protein
LTALKLCDFVAGQDGQNAEIYRTRGIIRPAAGRVAEALSDLGMARSLNPYLANIDQPDVYANYPVTISISLPTFGRISRDSLFRSCEN